MEESNEDPRVTPELYFLIAKFLSGGPLKETAKTLLKELESAEVLPRRLDWEGREHSQSYDELSSQYADMSWSRLVEVCTQALRLARLSGPAPTPKAILPAEPSKSTDLKVTAKLSLLSEGLVRPLPKYTPYKEDHSIVRRVARRELGFGCAAKVGGAGGKAIMSPRLLSGLQLQRRTLGHLSAVYCLLFDCTGRYVVTGADDLLVKVWSARDGRLLATLRGAGAEITDVCITGDGALLGAGSVERCVRVWRLDTAAPQAQLTHHTGTITAVHWSPQTSSDVRWLASTSTDGSVAFWTCSRSGQFLSQPVQYVERTRPGACHMICAAWSAGGAFLAAGSADHHVRLYQLEPGASPRRVLETPVHTDAVDSLCWARRGLRFVSGSKDGTAALWSLHAAQWRHTLLRCDPHGETTDNKRLKVTMVQWDSSDAYVVTAVSDCTIRVWCARTCVQVRVLTGHTDEAYVLEAHPYLAGVFLSAGHDGQLSVWDASTGETLATFNNKIEGQGSGAIFDAKWGGGTVIAASDSHGHLLLLGLGQGHKLFRQLPTELFFHTDYRPLVRDALGGALDEQTETPPHLMPPPFLVDVEGAPHPPHLQRLVPGRENLTLSQLIPVTGDDRDPLDMMIDALRRQNDEDAHLLNGMNPLFDGAGRSVWRGSGVRRTLGSWQRGSPLHNPHEFKPLVPPLPPAQLDQIEKQGTELYEMELQWYRRELRRRPVMINTAPRRRAPRPRPKPQPRTIPRVEPEPELSPESSGSDTSDVSVRLSADSRSSHSERLAYTTHDTDSSSRSGSRSDNSSSSKSSQYSDWEAGEKLAPPARARRRPVKQTKRYSPSTVAPKRSERVQPTASTSAAPAVPATTSAATSSVPSPTELPEAYRPGEWLTAVVPRKAPYYPQMGDHCVYFRVGHQRYFEAVSEKDVYKLNPRDKPWERTQINDCEPVKVVGIKYVIRPPRVACLRLASLRGRRSFTVRYHDMPDVIDFLVPMQQYVAAQNRGWTQGDRFRCMIDDSWWTGIILETSGPADASEDWDAAASYFLSLRVRWDNGEMERLSPWDLEPLDPQRLPSEPGGAVPVLPHELEAVLYRAEPEEWPPTGDRAEACRTIARHIEQVMTLSVAEPFVAPVDLQLYPTYALVVPYPIDLSTIKARFDNLFYRRAAAAQFDVRYLASNAEQFNRVHSPIVRQARLVTELLLHIITFWHTVDVVAKYHDLAANYHSSDEETQPLSKHKSRRRRSCNNKQPDWQDACSKLLSSLLASPDSEPFREPVNLLQAPDYHAVISHPMDLATVHKKLESGEYSNQQQFATDVRLIFHNSRQYNTNKRSRIYSMTVRLSALFAALWSRVPLQSRRSTRPARHSRRIRPDSERNGNTHVNGDADPSSRLSDPSDSSEDEALAMTSRRARERVQRYRQNSDSLDSDTPLNKHKKGKGVGKKSKVNTTVPEPSTSSQRVREEEEVPRNGVTSGSDTSGTEEYTNIEVLEEELVEDDVELTYDDNWSERARARDSSHDGSSSGSIVYTNIEVLDEELIEDDADWSEQARARKSYHNSTPASARKRRRIPSSGSSARSHRTRRISRGKRPSKQKRTRERITDGSSSSSTSAEGGPPADNHRYESDHSYHPRFSTDDDAPLHLIRQRQEVTGEDGAGPSNPRRNKKGRVRLRKRRTPTRKYNEDSEDDSIAAISKRLRATNTPRLAQLLANRRARQSGAPPLPALAAHTADHNYFNGHAQPQPLNGGAGTSATPERLPVSISSRGRVRKLTAKARGLLRD